MALSMRERQAITREMARRYARAGKRERGLMLDELCALFPAEETGIRALFADMYAVYDAVMGGDLVAVVPPTEA